MEIPATSAAAPTAELVTDTAPSKTATSLLPGAVPPNQLPLVAKAVLDAPVQVKAEFVENPQFRLFPPSATVASEYSLISVPEVLLESVTVM